MCLGGETTSTENTSGTSTNNGNTSANSNTSGNTAQLGTSTANVNPAIAKAATGNLDFVNNLQGKGFQGYTGQQVANLTPGQQGTIDAATGIANNGTGTAATNLIGGYANAPAGSVAPQTIAQNMSPYMNQYVMNALAPQLQQMDIQNAKTQNATDASATGSGAFGDARTGIERSTNAFNANVAREGVIGKAYNDAFNTAIGAGAQDTSNNLTGQTTNANLNEQALQRSLGGATALEGLQTQQLGTQGTANTLNQQNTAKNQADLTAQYNQWLLAQQYPFQTAQLANSTLGTATSALPAGQTTTQAGTSAQNTAATGTSQSAGTTTGTSTKTQPDNSGMALLGGIIGTAGKVALSDRRAKKDIDLVGKLADGSNVYSFIYKDDPNEVKQIGLMAQEVKKRTPGAVVKRSDGYLAVDYNAATALSRAMSAAI